MKNILLTAILFLSLFGLKAQDFTLSGTVTSADDGYEISFVSVKDTITKKGVFSNADGYYSIPLEKGTYLLYH